MSKPKHHPILIGTSVFAMLWVIARACVQSVTIDEADTYFGSVWREGLSHWDPSSNNHVLNTLLMKLLTQIFGASPLTLRLPALLGSALYIVAVYCLVRLLTDRRLLQWSLLVCLTYSPFVMDYLVAARGYSLASAFLLWMILLVVHHLAQAPEARASTLLRTSALISICGALSVCANFSFAVGVAMTGLGLFLWLCPNERRDFAKVFAAFTLPGLAVAYFIAGYNVEHWPKGQFTWGSETLWKTIKSLVSASLFEPNTFLLHPQLHHQFVHFGPFLYPALLAFVLLQLAVLSYWRRVSPLAVLCGLASLAALAVHQFLYSIYGILLPLDRTAMWLVLLFFVMAGALAAAQRASMITRTSSKLLTFILTLIACYNIGCLRLNYFNEWRYNSAMKHAYAVLARYNHQYGVTTVSANWRYVASLNCYRAMSGQETLERVPDAPGVINSYPPGYQAYVIYYPWDEGFFKKEGLKLIYHDKFSDVAVAVRPEVETANKP